MVGHQETLDTAAGDHVSFAFDGEVLTGGGYSHSTGEEWAWSVEQVEVTGLNVSYDALFAPVQVSWAGQAGENLSSEKGAVVGSATCWVASAGMVNQLISRKDELLKEAQRAAEERQRRVAEAYDWPSRPADPPQEPDHRHAEVIGGTAHETATFPAEAYEDVVEHYTGTFGRPPDFDFSERGDGRDYVEWVSSTPPPTDGGDGPPQTLTSVFRSDDEVVVSQSWNAPDTR
jgi:hypothetical protein